MNRARVLITGAGGGNVGMQVIDALKLAKNPYFIVATNSSPHQTGLYEADKGYLVPKAKEKNYISKLLKICEIEKIQAIVPGTEPELMVISDNREKFLKNKVLPIINSKEVIDICQDKIKTMDFLAINKILYPKFAVLKNSRIPSGFDFPLVVKVARGLGGSRNVTIAQNQKDLDFCFERFRSLDLVPLIQEYIGTPKQEYTVGILHDFEGNLIESIALKREISGVLTSSLQIPNKQNQKDILTISSGVSQGFVEDYFPVRRFAEKVAKALKSKGPLNIQCRKTPKGIFILEINPRFSGTTSIRSLLGYNEPDILIQKYILDKKIPKISYRKGLVLREFRMKYINQKEIQKLKKHQKITNPSQ